MSYTVTLHTVGAVVEVEGLRRIKSVLALLDGLIAIEGGCVDAIAELEVRRARRELADRGADSQSNVAEARRVFQLRGAVPLRVRDVAVELAVPPKRAWDAVARLSSLGLVAKLGRGLYVWTG